MISFLEEEKNKRKIWKKKEWEVRAFVEYNTYTGWVTHMLRVRLHRVRNFNAVVVICINGSRVWDGNNNNNWKRKKQEWERERVREGEKCTELSCWEWNGVGGNGIYSGKK